MGFILFLVAAYISTSNDSLLTKDIASALQDFFIKIFVIKLMASRMTRFHSTYFGTYKRIIRESD